jgi:hypothetical protein
MASEHSRYTVHKKAAPHGAAFVDIAAESPLNLRIYVAF